MSKTAILVDGGFYRKRATTLFGKKSPQERADELLKYCHRHLKTHDGKGRTRYNELYRIFYYDCPPADKKVFHPLTKQTIDLGKSELFSWTNDFFDCLSVKRKVALRLGELQENNISYNLKTDVTKKLCQNKISINDLKENDFMLNIQQKGVDMRIGLDIASLAHKKQVEQIVLISGDSDFVPAAKYARREGIDFILDPMWQGVKPNLNLHIDGLKQRTNKPNENFKDPLCVRKYYKEHIQKQ